MSEILKFEYEAMGPSFLAVVDSLHPSGAPIVGGDNPTLRMSLRELALANPTLHGDLIRLLAHLEDFVRSTFERRIANPEDLRKELIAFELTKREVEQTRLEQDRTATALQAHVDETRAELETHRNALFAREAAAEARIAAAQEAETRLTAAHEELERQRKEVAESARRLEELQAPIEELPSELPFEVTPDAAPTRDTLIEDDEQESESP